MVRTRLSCSSDRSYAQKQLSSARAIAVVLSANRDASIAFVCVPLSNYPHTPINVF